MWTALFFIDAANFSLYLPSTNRQLGVGFKFFYLVADQEVGLVKVSQGVA